MIKNIAITLFIIGIISLSFLIPKHKTKVELNFDVHHKKEFIHIENEVTKAEYQVKSEIKRKPAQVSTPKQSITLPKKVSAKDIELQYQFDQETFLAKGVSAIARSDFKGEQEDIIGSNFDFVFVRQQEITDKLAIYNSTHELLIPISNIIKIRADEAKRESIISRGFSEYLYLEKLKLLFVKANASDYGEVFESLKKEGFDPEYQVIEHLHQPM